MCSQSDDPTQHEHGGPYHDIRDKRQLAIHVGIEHLGADGHYRRLISPTAAFRSRWRRDELEREHRQLHEGEQQ